MTNNENVLKVVTEAIDELNEQFPKEEKVNKSADTVLFGSGGKLDSLGLVSLITTVEQKIEEKYGTSVSLLEDIDILENDSPLKTVKSLADYIASVLEKKAVE